MSNSKGNMEIMDVLSSIRRLVSEDRRFPAAERAEPSLRGPVPNAAEEGQVDAAPPGAEVTTPDPAPALAEAIADDLMLGAMAAPRAPDGAARRPGESRFVLTAALRVGEEADLEDDLEERAEPEVPSARLVERPARDLSSLEDTIAELEAAVAGIEEEFEPDGGDAPAHAELASVGPMPSWPVAERPVPATGGFHGIMVGFEAMPLPDDRLDLPINGDVTVPAARRGDDRPSGAGSGGGFFRAAARTGDSAPELPEGPLAEAVPPMVEMPPSAALTVPEVGDVPAADDVSEARAEDTAGDETASGEATEDVPAGEAERAFSRPIILRSRVPEPDPAPVEDATDDDSLDVADLAAEAEMAPPDGPDLQADTGDLTAADSDPEMAEESDLFDPLADADLDIDMLRDMVAEIVRDELRGTLGERITRNLRALVRREIDRALIAEGLKRD